MRLSVFITLSASLALSCIGTTGGDLLSFDAYAAGPENAVQGQPYSFRTGRGYEVILERARLHIGAVYLNQSEPISGGQESPCVLPGIYVAQVLAPLEVDILSPELQRFPIRGEGTMTHAAAGEVWLMGRDVNASDDSTVILDVKGTATKDDESYAFTAALTIGKNRAIPPKDVAYPGSNPLCRQRIVSPIPTNLTPTRGGKLVVRIDPAGMFANVEFSELDETSGEPPLFRFADASDGQPNVNLYNGLRSREGVYSFEWVSE